jgi:hypothetical protein
MKTYAYLIFVIIIAGSCSKQDPEIILNRSDWYLQRMNNGGSVHLLIEGTTTGDRLTIKTSGDGVVSDQEIELGENKQFSADVVISFTVSSVPAQEFVQSTELKAYKKKNMTSLSLTSGKLQY